MDHVATYEDLSADVFDKLCSIAVQKCHDRQERRLAGCGGHAMRKRVLLKNFVNDLIRQKADDEEEEEEAMEEEEEAGPAVEPEPEDANRTIYEHDDVEEMDDVQEQDDVSGSDCWMMNSMYGENHNTELSLLIGDAMLSGRECAAGGRLDMKSSEERLSIYDLCSVESEQADDGVSACNYIPATPYDCLYDSCSSAARWEMESPVVDAAQPEGDEPLLAELRPMRAEASDQLYLSLSSSHSLLEMRSYQEESVLTELSPRISPHKRPSEQLFLSIHSQAALNKRIKL